MEKIFKNFYTDLVSSKNKNSDPLKHFLFSSMTNTVLIFYLASKKKATLEELCHNIPPKVISRSTIQNILKEGTKILFFEKELNPSDKRAKYYKLSSEGKKTLEDWALNQKNNFSELKNPSKAA